VNVGLDTGFFVRLLEGDKRALEVWEGLREEKFGGVIGCVTLYELQRLGLRGAIDPASIRTLAEAIPHICHVVWLDEADRLTRAARLGHGHDLAMADALVMSALVDAGADRIYTTDADFERYQSGPEIVRL